MGVVTVQSIKSKYIHLLRARLDNYYFNLAPHIYDAVLLSLSFFINIFYKELRTSGASNIPKNGPIIFAVGPHCNQVTAFPQILLSLALSKP
jgi:hypothetical protein